MKQLKSAFVIDDDKTNNMICSKMMQKTSFCTNTRTFMNLDEALSSLEQLKGTDDFPEIILLDINMPPSSGWTFLKQYNESGLPDIHVFMLTAEVTEEAKKLAEKQPLVRGIIAKPLNPAKLEEISALI